LAWEQIPESISMEGHTPDMSYPVPDGRVHQTRDRPLALACDENARLVAGHCPVTWPALTSAQGWT